MINLNDIEYSIITEYSILKCVSELEVSKYILGQDFEPYELIKSPLRQETNPSFQVFQSEDPKTLLYKDFGTGECGNCFALLKRLHPDIPYFKLLKQVYIDLCINHTSPVLSPPPTYENIKHSIRIVPATFSKEDLQFWGSYGISAKTLKRYNVCAVSAIFYDQSEFGQMQPKFTYAFREFKDNKITYKIYKPFESRPKKWRTNTNDTIHQGYTQLSKTGKLLIITKSLKDVMSLRENTGIDAIGLQSESIIIAPKVLAEYLMRFRYVITCFDNDEAGQRLAQKYTDLFGLPSIIIPDYYRPAKDPSDLYLQQGKANYLKIIKQLIGKI